ncbi:DUF6298 domain-containing protein [Adhaeribacter rhizoryzae]|uniref:DUF6298 domain-containing protein n=1 Tax=Adhaeribacter rhizoryzae TaxID=2607907 RepID=UPI001CC1F762|nr:DUF6298 domain-containing protein [Adhaeribacter rhizoryzae]
MHILFKILPKSKRYYFLTCLLVSLLSLHFPALAQNSKPAKPASPVSLGKDGRLFYSPDAKGNRIPDFSYCGYAASEAPIPNVPIKLVVPLQKGDATRRIQAALDYVAGLPMDKSGFRGAVLLEKGTYEVAGSLHIKTSGVVLRGSGIGEDGTVLIAAGKDRQTFITLHGVNNKQLGTPIKIKDSYVPVNANQIRIENSQTFKVGDHVQIQRPSTAEWIKALGTDHFGGGITALGWKPGQRDLFWDRKIVAVNGETLTLDAPITTALDANYGGGTVTKMNWPGRISRVGVENLRLRSAYDKNNPKDEDHRWMAITLENIQDAWVRQVIFEHFAGSAVAVFESAKRVTVEDCKSLAPVSEIGGQRRYTFFTNGQQTLFQRNYAEQGYHDFSVGFCAAGPNAFVQCESVLPYNFSGAIDSWAAGVLFDIVNVDGHALSFKNRGQDGQGAGWSAANSVFWQCAAARIDNYSPPTAQNWAFGTWAQFSGDGYWEESNSHIKPRSLFYAQLADRLGKEVGERAQLLPMETDASSSPPVAVAMALTAEAVKPAPRLIDWIDGAPQRNPIPTQASKVKTVDQLKLKAPVAEKPAAPMHVENGWLVRGKEVLTGKRQDVPWWSGSSRIYALAKTKPHITRFVPGRTGHGLTDDLEEVTDNMKKQGQVALEHNYGLWYERRRDDHERIRRMDGEVWPPFYELPFARSGKETAWDGLSKYDLRKPNNWYWSRLKTFADLADQKGLLLVHQQYFQHNIIEAGAHYADFPWRPANNINETGFPEPVPYAGDKRIFLAEQFYDVNHPKRRELHRAYIQQCLNNFNGNTGVLQLISAEYTGPLHFVQFWLDTIREWEKETGKNALVGLSTTKDVQDAILTDQARAAIVDVIDIRYWHYREDGTAYAPAGGQNLAPRQHARLVKPGKSSFAQVYRAVCDYRKANPGKAVMYSASNYDHEGWAAFLAGGSLAEIPVVAHPGFLTAAAQMQPLDLPNHPAGQYALGNKNGEYIIYQEKAGNIPVDLKTAGGKFRVRWFDPATGQLQKEETSSNGKLAETKKLPSGPVVVWISRS